MKKIYILLTALICLAGLLLAGCSGGGYVIAAGPVIDKTYDYQDFTGVEISNSFEYDVRQSDTYSIVISTHENVVPHLDVFKSGDTLVVRLQPGRFTHNNSKVAITLPELKKLSVSGASKGTASDFKSSSNFDLKVTGASQLDMDLETGPAHLDITGASKLKGSLKAQETRLVVSGASRCELNGAAGLTDIEISGASKVNLPDFQMQDTNIEASGASQATINTSGTLNVNLSGASSLYYLGNPTLHETHISGASKLNSK
jgi:hypothetical protein